MARVKVLVNSCERKVIETQVKLEGERAIDESIVVFPPGEAVCVSDEIKILQDAVCLNGLVGMYNFQACVIDESGLCNNATGMIPYPRRDLTLTYCTCNSTIISEGYRSTCITTNGCITCATGKVNTKGINFDGCNDYITVGPEEIFDFDQSTPFSFSTWIKTSDTCVPIISKKATSSTDKGWEINLDACGQPHVRLTNTASTNELEVRGLTAINTCTWTHLGVTYSGVPGCGSTAIKLFINGDTVSKVTVTDNLTSCLLNCSLISLASYADGTPLFTGVLDDTTLWNAKTISEEEMKSMFNRGILEEVNGRTGSAMRFNGVDSYAEVPYTTDHDFAGNFDIQVWARWQGTSTGYIYSRRNSASTGWALAVNRLVTGDVVAEIDGNLIKTCGETFNDFNWHFIRVYRGSDNVVHLEIDNVEKNTAVIGSNLLLLSPSLFIASNHNSTSYFDGDLNTIRIYKDVALTPEQAGRVYTCVQSWSTMKFGGTATKVTKEISKKNVVAQSFGEVLGTIEVRAQEYICRSPEFIIEDLVRANTELNPHIHGSCSGVIISRFNADGKLIDIIRDLTQLTGRTFNTDGLKQFHIHDSAFNNTCFVFTHGCNARNFQDVEDDTEIINDLLVIGENKRHFTIECFTGDGIKSEFILSSTPTSTKVIVNCVEQTAEEDYTACTLNKSIIFNTCSIPLCGQSVVVEYEFELPLLIRGEKQSSINLYGRHSKRLVMPWIKTRNDGIRFINGYLNKFKEIRTSLKLELPTMKNSLNEGDVVRIINNIKNIDDTFVIKSLVWRYPDMKTELLVGEFKFDDLEYEKQIIEKLHDLESAVTEVKELTCSEQLEEVLCMVDTFNIIEGITCGTIFVETLCLTDGITVTVVSQGKYNQSTYGGGDIYGTCQVSGGYTCSGYTFTGYTTFTQPSKLLQENNDAILKEDGDYIYLEDGQ